MLITFLFGCAASLQGIWDGTCTFEDQQNLAELDVTADVRSDNGYLLGGEMQLTDWDRNEYSTPLDGDHSGKYVTIRGDFDIGEGLYRFQVEAVRVGSALEGDCMIKSPSSPGGLVGYTRLER